MGRPIAKRGDRVVGVDTHVVMVSSPGGPVPTPTPMPFAGELSTDLSTTVFVDNLPVAVEGSGAPNQPPHVPTGGPFQTPPHNRSKVTTVSDSVLADGKGVARMGDGAETCNDPSDAEVARVIAAGTAFAG